MLTMKAVILAGGLGTRISEETHLKPKPMVTIGGQPVLWHVLKIYAAHGINDFVICAGYKGCVIKEYFANHCLHTSDVTFDMRDNSMEIHQRRSELWRVTIVDTGESTQTGGRLRRVSRYLDDETCRELMLGQYGHKIVRPVAAGGPVRIDDVDTPYASDESLHGLIYNRGL